MGVMIRYGEETARFIEGQEIEQRYVAMEDGELGGHSNQKVQGKWKPRASQDPTGMTLTEMRKKEERKFIESISRGKAWPTIERGCHHPSQNF